VGPEENHQTFHAREYKAVETACDFKKQFNTDQWNKNTLLRKWQTNGWNLNNSQISVKGQ
jgi:hypothetical protein